MYKSHRHRYLSKYKSYTLKSDFTDYVSMILKGSNVPYGYISVDHNASTSAVYPFEITVDADYFMGEEVSKDPKDVEDWLDSIRDDDPLFVPEVYTVQEDGDNYWLIRGEAYMPLEAAGYRGFQKIKQSYLRGYRAALGNNEKSDYVDVSDFLKAVHVAEIGDIRRHVQSIVNTDRQTINVIIYMPTTDWPVSKEGIHVAESRIITYLNRMCGYNVASVDFPNEVPTGVAPIVISVLKGKQ